MKKIICYTLSGMLALSFACINKQAAAQSKKDKPTAVTSGKADTQPAAGEGVEWLTIEQAVLAQEKNPKPIMIDVYTKWCGPCKMLSKNTLEDARVAKYLSENYYCVKFDAEAPDTVYFGGNTFANPDYVPNQPGRNGVHQFARYLNVGSYPTLFFMNKTGEGIGPLVGYRTPAQIEIFLHYFAEEKYTTIQTPEQFQEYEKGFVVTWN